MKQLKKTLGVWSVLLFGLWLLSLPVSAQKHKNDSTELPKALLRRIEATSNAADSLSSDSLEVLLEEQLKEIEALEAPVDTAQLFAKNDSVQQQANQLPKARKQWIPDPKRATWLALVIPGGGQIYNRKYWKLPLVYGGFVACAYALNWNNQMYSDYSQAYLDIMDDDPNTKSYMDFLPPNYDITGSESRFQEIFRKKKDYYRRYRDMSVFCFIGVYLLSVIDAYVDAELSNFDISKDLGMKVEPAVINNGSTKKSGFGLQCSIRF